MTTTEWLPEPSSVSLPAIVSSSDLFDGDLFGDELIDIYNAAVGEGHETVATDEIPTLLPQTSEHSEAVKPEEVQSAVDGGLGAFRTSSSFNDLSTLLNSTTSDSGETGSTVAVTGAVNVEHEGSATEKKHTLEADPNDAPQAKKQCTGVKSRALAGPDVKRTRPRPAATAQVIPGSPTKDKEKAAGDTPNPLTSQVAVAGINTSIVKLPPGQYAPPSVASAPAPATATATAPSNTTATSAAPATTPDIDPMVVTPTGTVEVTRDVILSNSPAVASAAATVPVPTLANSSATVTTEADFKSVAQAAVSSLILNVGTSTKTDSCSVTSEGGKKIDTSTAHIKALTGNNWVAACSGTAGCSVSASSAEAKANNRARRQNLTPDERARQNRDRNREHARNTRLRKKAYVEELKRTLTELVAQRDAAELEKRQTAQREVEQREVRFRVIEEFLKLRGRNEPNFARWAAILEDGFSLTLPVTGYRKMVHIENKHDGVILEQVLTGVSEIMADSSHFASFLQSFGDGSNNIPVTVVYHCDRKNFLMDGSNAVLDWTASSVGAVKQGARVELSLRGTLRAKFSPASNKLLSANLTFDSGLVMSQLHQLSGTKQVQMQAHSQVHSQVHEHAHVQVQAHSQESDDLAAATAAAEAASSQADAILDSLEMPHINATVPSAVTLLPSSAASITSSEKGENSSDESVEDSSVPCQQE